MTLTADVTDAGTIGFRLKGMFDLIETEKYEYGFFESIPAGFVKTADKLGNYISSMSLLFTKEPPSLDFLQAGFVHSSMKENKILYFTKIALYNLYQHFVMMKGSTPRNLFNCILL